MSPRAPSSGATRPESSKPMTDADSTRVIVRVDDLTPALLESLADWFLENHPDVPVAGFAVGTQKWPDSAWRRAACLVADHGWEVGGHTRNHVRLPLVSTNRARQEVRTNIDDIEAGLMAAGLDYDVHSFAYPFGLVDERSVDVVKEVGLDCGLTYTDALPYTSAIEVPEGENRYRWGVANNGSLSIDAWNAKFDYVWEFGDCYVLCLHPDRWESVLLNALRALNSDSSLVQSALQIVGTTLLGHEPEGWRQLDEHIDYIKQHENVSFTTFSECIEDKRTPTGREETV